MSVDHRSLALLLFGAFVAVTLGITTWVSRDRRGSAEEFYTGGRLFSPMENGFAIAGDYMSAASFLGISGLIALFGYDGMLYSVGFLVAWLVVLLLVAELVRNCGRFTLADVVATRMRERPVRIAAGTSSIVVSVLYLVAQMVGAGSLVALLLGGASEAARAWTVIGVGALMVVYVTLGGMRATTWIQIVKAVLLMAGTVALTVLVLIRFHGDVNALLTTAPNAAATARSSLPPVWPTAAAGPRDSTSSAWGSRWCSARPDCRTSFPASTPCRPPAPPAGRSSGRSDSSAASI